ncbi:hypothetical protein HYC85_025270 [Camellia sinensis]|uniref:Uncharacterized protein n=1 Tax=Camellia sinensis TaxID=4442 RepID=A0A7J7GEB9_CAMSI|nr:hypothetical protein HYC85_025270 [Camellia sinensis]
MNGAGPDKMGPQPGGDLIGLKWGPKGAEEALAYIPFLRKKQWLMAKGDRNPPPIRNIHQKKKKKKARKQKRKREER